MWTDLRLAARLLLKDRWFTLAAGGALALGIAANATVFSLFNGIFLRSLPFEAPDRMVVLNARVESNPDSNFPISYLELLDWQAGARTFDGLAGFTDGRMNIADNDREPERLPGAYVSAHTFALIGQRPTLGRAFRDDDDRPGATPVVMLSFATWQGRYASNPGVVGRLIRVNGVPSTVIGVMPRGFGFPNDAALWQTLAMLPADSRTRRETRSLLVLGRMASGVTPERARADIGAVAATLPGRSTDPTRNVVPKLRPFREFFIGTDAQTLFGLFLAAVGFVLLIACANVANLLLARGAVRSREITVRMSVGASRGRIVRQLLVDSLLLAGLAAAAGLAMALAGVRLFENATAGTGAPYWIDFSLDARVVAFLIAVSVGAAVISGLMPALHTTRASLVEGLSDGARGASAIHSRRWTGGLVIAQLALTLTLLMSAGLMVRELSVLRSLPIGVETTGITVLNLDLGTQTQRDDGTMAAFYRRLDDRLGSIPGIAVTYASAAPLGGASERDLGIAGRPTSGASPPNRRVSNLAIGPTYFEALGADIVRGRAFTRTDRSGVAIVNQRLVSMFFPEADPIGKQIRLEAAPAGVVDFSEWLTIVGVAPNIRQRSTGAQEFDPLIYVPYAGHALPFATILARSPADAGTVTARLREELQAIDPDLPLFDVRTLDAAIAFDRWPTRVFGTMFGAFAGMALLLATIGLYGVTAYSVTQRTREIGIRTALGAQALNIWWTVARRASVQVAAGLLLGAAGALSMGRILQGVLSAVPGTDPLTLAGVSILLVLVAFVACLIPARRAMRLNPVVALRAE